MYAEVPILNRGKMNLNSGFYFAYLISLAYVVIYEIYHNFFIESYQKKKNKRLYFNDFYAFPVNNKTFLKGFFTIFSLFIAYLFVGFLGVLFLFYFFTQINIFHKYKTLSSIYNVYIKTIVYFCGVSSIHSINFTKL